MEATQSKVSGEFNWKTPETIRASLLEGDNAQAIHEEISQTYKGNPLVIGNVNYNKKSGLIEGSHPRYVVAVNGVFRKHNLPVRTASPADLGRIVESNILNSLRGTYEDSALVLRSEENPKRYLAQHLAKQLKARNIDFSPENPAMIYLGDLDLVADTTTGLAFKLRDDAQVINVPQLAKDCRFIIVNKDGVPIPDEKGNRHLYTINSGLSRLDQGGDLDLGSGWDYLGPSNAYGRVVVVSEADAKKFLASREEELRRVYESQIDEFAIRYERAQRVLQGKE